MKKKTKLLTNNERGAVAVYVGLLLIFLLMLASLAIDVGHLYAVRNELHNGADAAALAAASMLFDDNGQLTRNAAIAEGERVATANRTGTQFIGERTVETGHWSFTNQEFTPNAGTTQTDWRERSFSELDLDTGFINAVRVRTDRSDTPSFLAGILGIDQFFVTASAVAYIGFAGTIYKGEVDQPIAICEESITVPCPDSDGSCYSCNMGRMLNSGSNIETHNTGGWTNFTQPCDTANASDMSSLICSSGNNEKLQLEEGGVGTTGGVQDTTFRDLYDCWEAATNNKTTNWDLTLPVIKCPGNNVSNCADFAGAVNIRVIWMIDQNDPLYNDVPRQMTVPDFPPWSCPPETDGFQCWISFVDHFGLQNVDAPPEQDDNYEDYEDMYQKKNIFFLTACEFLGLKGGSGGENFGVLAKIPKLVQ